MGAFHLVTQVNLYKCSFVFIIFWQFFGRGQNDVCVNLCH